MTVHSELASAYAHGPGKQIELGPAPPRIPELGPRIPLAELASLGPFAAAVARLLVDALTPIRWETWNLHNDHRSFPSPRSAYLIDVALVANGTRLGLDPARRALIGSTLPTLDGPARLEFQAHPERLPTGYGEFADALVELEAGHVAGALVEHAARLGLSAAADATGVTLRPVTPQRAGALPARSSGIGPLGFSADPRPLPAACFHAVVDAITNVPKGTLTHPGLTLRLAVHNVTGLRDGWYPVDSSEPDPPGDAMAGVQGAFGHPRTAVDVAGMNLAIVMSADIPAAVAEGGPGSYRDLLRAAGATAQHACSAAASVGMFCRPIRSVDDPALEAAAALPLPHSLLYVLLAGRPRVACFPYDLTPLEPL
jgi:hypothetical protein